MASAKQIAWRKKFARMAKSGKFKKAIAKSKKSKSNLPQRITTKPKEKLYRDYAHYGAPLTGSDVGIMGESNPHNESSFTIKEYLDNEAINHHAENSLLLTKKYGTNADIRKMEAINKRHQERGSLTYADLLMREKLTLPFYNKLIKGTSHKQLTRESHPELYD